jgi:hypothetical protein
MAEIDCTHAGIFMRGRICGNQEIFVLIYKYVARDKCVSFCLPSQIGHNWNESGYMVMSGIQWQKSLLPKAEVFTNLTHCSLHF